MRSTTLLAFVASLASLFSPSTASAESIVVVLPQKSAERTGLAFGANIGRGNIDMACPGCGDLPALEEALSYGAYAGWMINGRLALLGDFWDVRYNDRNSTFFTDSSDHLVSQQMFTANAQLWLIKQVWIRAGVGVARHISDSQFAKRRGFPDGRIPAGNEPSSGTSPMPQEESGNAWAPSMVAAIGWEFAHTTSFAVDVQVRVANSRHDNGDYNVRNLALMFGASWY